MPRILSALARLLPGRMMALAESKASRTGPLIALETLGRPAWSPRDYGAFAREGYMQNAVCYRAVRMIAEAAASVPLLLYEGREEIEEHPFLDLMARPSADHTGTDFLESWYGFLLVSGNAYCEAVAVGGRLRELHALRPDRMKVVPGIDGWPEAYEYTAGGATVRFAGEAVPGVRPILHVRLFHPANDHYGMSPIEAAATAIDIHNTASRWNKALLDNSARPSGALVYAAGSGRMSAEQFERLKAELEGSYQGAKHAGRPLLLEGGLDWKPLSLSPKDMDFIEAKHAAAREIALALGVPPMLLGIPGDNTYSNYQEAQRAFWRGTVLPLVLRTAKAMSAWLAPAWGGALGAGTSMLELRPDLDQVEGLAGEREALWARLNATDFLTANEKREAVGYPAIEAEAGPVEAGAPEAGSDPAGLSPGVAIGLGPEPTNSPALKYSPDQPRVPRGNEHSGEWTKIGGGAGSGTVGSRPAGNQPIGVASRSSGPRILGRGPGDFGKRVNTPSPKDVNVKMDHVLDRHTAQGSAYKTSRRDGGRKSAFPEWMKPKDIEKAVREAYSNAREVSPPQYNPNGKIRLLEGKSGNLTIQMYYNSTTKTIESAFTR